MSAGKILLVVLGFLIAGVVIAGVWATGIYNRLVTLQQGTDAAWAQVQNVYQRRTDLIPNLVNTVSGAANFEKSTLNEVVSARASVGLQVASGAGIGRTTAPSRTPRREIPNPSRKRCRRDRCRRPGRRF